MKLYCPICKEERFSACTETHPVHVPQGVSTLAGECENRPTESEYIAFFYERLTETRNHEKI